MHKIVYANKEKVQMIRYLSLVIGYFFYANRDIENVKNKMMCISDG